VSRGETSVGTYGEGDVTIFHRLADQVPSFSGHMGILNREFQQTSTRPPAAALRRYTNLFAEHKCHFTLCIHVSLLDLDQGVVGLAFSEGGRMNAVVRGGTFRAGSTGEIGGQ
jgi:hypothetical protein